MTDNHAFAHLKIRELEGRILARRRLAGETHDRAWHLDIAKVYEAEIRQLQVELQMAESLASKSNSIVRPLNPSDTVRPMPMTFGGMMASTAVAASCGTGVSAMDIQGAIPQAVTRKSTDPSL